MSKFMRVLSIILIVFSLIISFYSVYASDINMNLTSEENVQNTGDDYNIVTSDNQTADQTQSAPDADSATIPTSVGAVEEEGLGFSNILSILLITVGIVLIFLAIAIIIKLR